MLAAYRRHITKELLELSVFGPRQLRPQPRTSRGDKRASTNSRYALVAPGPSSTAAGLHTTGVPRVLSRGVLQVFEAAGDLLRRRRAAGIDLATVIEAGRHLGLQRTLDCGPLGRSVA